jgi:hypothetical protein
MPVPPGPTLPEPYVAYTCGIIYENEMNDITVKLSDSKESQACSDEECGWFGLIIEPIKYIERSERPYMPEYDSDE